jgi:Tol biopolymer transport system component
MHRFQLIHARSIGVALLVLASLLLTCRPAYATFPGKNGRIAFIIQPDVFTMNPDGSGVKQLTSFGSNEAIFGLGWSPDGSQLVFARARADFSASQIWIMNRDGSNQRQLLNDPHGFDDEPSFSPDGNQVVFQRCKLPATQPCAIFRVGVDGTDLTALTHYTANTDVIDLTPAYSPDGATIGFFGGSRGGVLAANYFMNADGSDIRQITPSVLEAFIPDWSPDGTKIAFCTRAFYPPNTINPQLFVSNSDGRDLTQLTFPGAAASDTFVSWAPQGNAIVFERDTATSSAIYVLNVDETGTSEKVIFQAPARPRSASAHSAIGMEERFARKHHARLIESGGSNPKWGPAPN